MAFPYVAPTPVKGVTEEEILDALDKAAKDFAEQGNNLMEKNLRQYIDNREKFVSDNKGKYVRISEKGLDIEDDGDHIGFTDRPGGLLLKVGQEIEPSPSHSMYHRHYNAPTSVYTMPISFGNKLDNRVWMANVDAIIDTGCTRTTFDKSIIGWIRGAGAQFTTRKERVDVVGGRTDVDVGVLDIDLCGIPFSGVTAGFADLNGRIALIGTDLLNSGKLDVECGTRLSFTRH